MLLHESDRSSPKLGRVLLPLIAHASNPSRVGASDNPGAIQGSLSPCLELGGKLEGLSAAFIDHALECVSLKPE